jgi:hypothetical protein
VVGVNLTYYNLGSAPVSTTVPPNIKVWNRTCRALSPNPNPDSDQSFYVQIASTYLDLWKKLIRDFACT